MFAMEDPHPSFQQCKAHVAYIYEKEHKSNDECEDNQSVEALELPEPLVAPKISYRSLIRYATMCDSLEISKLVDILCLKI